MKKYISSIVILAFVLVPTFTHAQTDQSAKIITNNPKTITNTPKTITNSNTSQDLGIPNPIGVGSIPELIFKVVNMFMGVAYAIIAFFLIFSGFKFVTAQGSTDKLNDAKHMFMYTIIGAAIILGAQLIKDILQNIFSSL